LILWSLPHYRYICSASLVEVFAPLSFIRAGADPAFVHNLNIGRADLRQVALHPTKSLTRSDDLAFLALAERFSLKTASLVYPLPQADEALATCPPGALTAPPCCTPASGPEP